MQFHLFGYVPVDPDKLPDAVGVLVIGNGPAGAFFCKLTL